MHANEGRTSRWKSKLLLVLTAAMRSAGVTFSAAPEPPYPLAGPVSFESATTDPNGTFLNLDPDPKILGSVGGSGGSTTAYTSQVYFMSAKARAVLSTPAAGLRYRGRVVAGGDDVRVCRDYK